ncbi:hypothetical protein DRW71_19100 [Salmonella enterica subsp. diarizonae]|uniref:Multidrug efflux MFS transporter n=2 Tax=Salmonella enterica TaxID=28901 RepID=A0A5V4Z978_SALER|nr:hypothetical protein [Salmonella enterica subsp. diarizonae]EAO1752623.1 MFS transporter [Salmonella enterica]EBR3877489.1 multidrug efflux MFS transporter [Salmonella enterica subsp. arizonae]EBV2373564.1 hypothetical protein [Salmonella enterica subsp. enterica serovar Enteritidis]ECH9561775.1 MFS transporter [Salmonella enterica subsp. salamae]EDX3146826.1 multidrug efflux MFS transporter [Salmonella enterica subsp. diarizonae serovar 61:l,v:1,5,7]EGL0767706.1 multidrug efflux MFS trans
MLLSESLSYRLGRRRIFIVGMVFFTVSLLACALSVHSDILIIARIIQGIAGAMVFGTAGVSGMRQTGVGARCLGCF